MILMFTPTYLLDSAVADVQGDGYWVVPVEYDEIV